MLLTNASIITCDGPDIERGFILIRDKKIAAVGKMQDLGELSQNADSVFDLSGKTVFPGFIDAHCHIGIFEECLGFEGDDGNEDTDPCTPELRALDAVNPFDPAFKQAYESGVTTVMTGPGSSNPIGGQMCILKTFGRRIDNMIVMQPAAIKFAFGENPKSSYHQKSSGPATRMAAAAVIRKTLYGAKRYMEDIERFRSGSNGAELPEYNAKYEALLPLLRGEIKAHIHAHRSDDIFTGIRIAEEFGFDYVLIHCTEGHLVADILGELHSSAICGPIISSRMKPELSNYTLNNVPLLRSRGVTAAICTDHPELPISSLALSSALALGSGASIRTIAEAITIIPARILGIDCKCGSVTAGKDADLVIFDDPDAFPVSSSPSMVFIEGKRVF